MIARADRKERCCIVTDWGPASVVVLAFVSAFTCPELLDYCGRPPSIALLLSPRFVRTSSVVLLQSGIAVYSYTS